MAEPIRISFVRPDDLLNLQFATVNLRLDASNPQKPVLVTDDPTIDALLIVTFPPQTIFEEAFFEQPALGDPPAPVQQPEPPNQKADLGGPPAPRAPGQNRFKIGGPTRLVFRVPSGTAIPYTSAGLLNWSDFELVVAPLADVPAGAEPKPGVDRTIREPTSMESTLQLPFRLHLSPTHAAGWQHSIGVVNYAGRAELWHTRLAHRADDGTITVADEGNPIGLRAIWSPDYRAGQRVPSPDDSGLPGAIAAMNVADRHQIVVLTAAFDGYARSVFQGFLPAPVDATFVQLSPLGGWLRSAGNWDPPTLLLPPKWVPPRHPGRLLDLTDQAVLPRPSAPAPDVHATATAPNSSVDDTAGSFVDPATAGIAGIAAEAVSHTQRVDTQLIRGAYPIGSGFFEIARYRLDPDGRLDLSQWVHQAAQGRDHYVRLVYEGNLGDVGHPASLVKVTERRFEAGQYGKPVAYLRQYMYIVVRQPEVTYAGLANGGRGLPFTKVRLTTLVTPHIDYPYLIKGDPTYIPPGKIDGTDRSFWVTVGGLDFLFHGVATDLAGNEIDFVKPLIFVPLSETAWSALGNATTSAAGRKRLQARVPGQRITFAPPDPAGKKDNTSFVAESFQLDHEGIVSRDAFFRPLLYQAQVHIPAVEALTGSSQTTGFAYAQDYLSRGFGAADNLTDVFGRIVSVDANTNTLIDAGADAAFQAVQAGGFATPSLSITTLSRQLGPLGGSATDALTDRFDPSSVLAGADVTLFGAFPLSSVLIGGSASANAPKMQIERNVDSVVAVLDWACPVQPFDGGVVTFNPVGSQGLQVHAEITKDATGSGSSTLHGSLDAFDITFLDSLIVHFTSFVFDARSGQKTSVQVTLDDAGPVEFVGDLAFVEELRKLIPPGVFGPGVSVDLIENPLGVQAGLTITLPPAEIGVFSLKNISFSAALTVPFLDGKPIADFGFARKDAPFALAVLIFGGGGFFHIQVDTDGVRLLEAALEFGAMAALDIGVASGEVHIMAGIYFQVAKRDSDQKMVASLSGYLRCGGSLCVLGIVNISVEFYLSFTYYGPPLSKAKGRATLTVCVEIGPFSKSVDLTVEKSFGGQGGDPNFGQMMDTPALWAEYASAFA